jgi:hypothetical protein
VNRFWQNRFGAGPVCSVDAFGTPDETPSHPDLLAQLVMKSMHNGWPQKQSIRSIVLSRTDRLISINDEAAMKVDPNNRQLWRMNRIRLDAEALRDQLLAVSGELVSSNGGPGLVLEEVENCGGLVQRGMNPSNYTHRKPRAGEAFVRMIDLPVMRINIATHDRLRSSFDFVNPAQVAGQRSQTVVPTQALFVMNNEVYR